jgi:hypothetical protein
MVIGRKGGFRLRRCCPVMAVSLSVTAHVDHEGHDLPIISAHNVLLLNCGGFVEVG